MRRLLLAGITVATLALSGCAGALTPDGAGEQNGGVGTRYGGFPEGGEPMPDDALLLGVPVAVWVEPGATFAVATFGSSSCVADAVSIEADGEASVVIRFESSKQDPCTADLAPTTYEFTVPDGVNGPPLAITLVSDTGGDATTLLLD